MARRRQSYLLRDRARRCGAEVLHSHFGDRAWSNIDNARRLGLKHAVTFYGYDVSRLPKTNPVWRDRYQDLFATADIFLCEGPHLGRALATLGCPQDKIRVQHLGIDLDNVTFQARRWRPGEPLKVLLAGSFVEKKGFPFALEALGRIKERAELEITVIGDANQQERSKMEKSRIFDAISRGGLENRVRMLGYQPYATLLAEACRNHLFVSPSVTASDGDTEGGAPVTVIEMAASGMPVVSSLHCDIPDVLQDGVTGLLAAERDLDGLESKLLWLVGHPERWKGMATAARRHIEAEFSAPIQGERLAAHYDALLLGA